tara:strand:- start:353 stop:1582 length:1230 start_codon:yes stop_codon:yes gene_type:complete
MSKKIAIIGGGIVGMCSAFLLHQAGHEVVLIDAQAVPGNLASNSNAMQLCYGTIAPYAGMGDIKKYARYLAYSHPSCSVYVRQDYSLRFLKFLLLSGWTALPRNAQETRQKLYELAEESCSAMMAFRKDYLEIDFHYKPTGKMRLYESRAAFEGEAEQLNFMNEKYGIGVEVLDSAETYAREPALREKAQTIFVSTYCDMDASGDSGQLARQMHMFMQGSDRYDYRANTSVDRLEVTDGAVTGIQTSHGDIHADCVVVAAGAASTAILETAGVSLPMIPVKGYSLTVENPPFDFYPCISDISQKFAYNTYGKDKRYLRLSGLMDFVGHDTTLNTQRIDYLKTQIQQTFPTLDLTDAVARCGLRPVMGASLPVVGQRGPKNLWVNTGQGVYGWTLAMGSAKLLKTAIDQD